MENKFIFEALDELKNDTVLLYPVLAFWEEKRGNSEKAEEYLKAAILRNYDKCEIYNSLIENYEKSGKYGEELERFYWELIRLAYNRKEKGIYTKCIDHFTRKLAGHTEKRNTDFTKKTTYSAGSFHGINANFDDDSEETDETGRGYFSADYEILKAYNAKLGTSVLEVGCKKGINSIILARNGHFVCVIDESQAAIEYAEKLRKNESPEIARRITLGTFSIEQNNIKPQYFDSAVIFNTDNTDENYWESLLKSISDSLKPGGSLLISFASVIDYVSVEKIKLIIQRVFGGIKASKPEGKENSLILIEAEKTNTSVSIDEKQMSLYKNPEAFNSGFISEYYTLDRAHAIIEKLEQAVTNSLPFSLIRISDIEARFLAYGRTDLRYGSIQNEIKVLLDNLGVDVNGLGLSNVYDVQNEIMEIMSDADILGTHHKTVNTRWNEDIINVYKSYNINDVYLPNEYDIVINAELLDQGYLCPLFENRRLLLIGNSSVRFANQLRSKEYRKKYKNIGMPLEAPCVAGSVYIPHNGAEAFNNLDVLWKEVQSYDFDIAVIAASITGKILAGRIKKYLGKIALDIGWSMQYLSGVSSPVAEARDENYMKGRRGFATLFKGRTS